MSQFRVEKRRAEAEVTLATGASVRGSFFLAGSSAGHAGPERIADLLNAEAGFFPFEPAGARASETVMINRAHVVSVRLLERPSEPQLDSGYVLATERRVAILLSTGVRIIGAVRVYRPHGHDRLSDYARSTDAFCYVENRDGTFVVNSAHIVELRETLS
jgi:hypothetical protein